MPQVVAYIGIGSNLDSPLRHAEAAVRDIEALDRVTVQACSRWYRSTPVGPPGQPDYINGVVEVFTDLDAGALLLALQEIENRHGRERKQRWGPRTLDLDILLYGNRIIATADLQVPHRQLSRRNFVLYPLADIVPQLVLPGGTTLSQLVANVSSEGIVALSQGD